MLMLDTRMEPAVARGMVQGAPDALRSEFHLSYTMLLNLALGEAATEPEALLRASFRQFQTERALPALRARTALEARCRLSVWAACWLPSNPAVPAHATYTLADRAVAEPAAPSCMHNLIACCRMVQEERDAIA